MEELGFVGVDEIVVVDEFFEYFLLKGVEVLTLEFED